MGRAFGRAAAARGPGRAGCGSVKPQEVATQAMAFADEKGSDQSQRGTQVGGPQMWSYPDGKWTERKLTPQRWDVAFTSLQRRRRRAPEGSGAEVGSGHHWLVVAHQWAGKMDANTYATHLEGSKHLLGIRKPGWNGWSTQQEGHKSARVRTIAILEELITELRGMADEAFEDPRDDGAMASLLEVAGSPRHRLAKRPKRMRREQAVAASRRTRRSSTRTRRPSLR